MMAQTSKAPLVSVVIPIFNGARFLPGVIQNILEQHYAPLEILIIDDGSTDATPMISKEYSDKARYVRQANLGPASARNTGLGLAKGDVVAFLDVDDVWPNDKLHHQVSRLLHHSDLDIIMGKVEFFADPPQTNPSLSPHIPQQSLINVYFGSGVFRKTVFSRVGQFDERLRYSEDHDWFLRAREMGVGILIMDKVTLYHRIHDQGMTSNKDAFGYQLPQVLKNSLARRKKTVQGIPVPLFHMSMCCEKTNLPHARESRENA